MTLDASARARLSAERDSDFVERGISGIVRDNISLLEKRVCAKINSVFLLNKHSHRVRIERLWPQRSGRRQNAAIVRARHYIWFFLHHHPAFDMTMTDIAEMSGWDHSTVCYGVCKMRDILQNRPYSVDAAALFELSRELAPTFGAVDIFAVAQPRPRGRR